MTSGEDKLNADSLSKERQKVYDARRRDRLFKLGLCRRCGGKLLLPGYTVCADCLEKARAQARDRYWRLKAAGLCPHCGKPKRPDRSECDECLSKRNSNKKKRKSAFKSLGLCSKCGSRLFVPGRALCEICAANSAESTARYQRRNPEKSKESTKKTMHRLWNERRAAGLCPKCGGELEPGYKTCAKCRIKSREWSRRKREKERLSSGALSQKEKQEKGICLRCGKPTGGAKAYCPECLERMSERMTEWHRKRREEESARNTP